MGQDRSFVDILRERALRQPDRPAYTFLTDGEVPEARLTYRGLDEAARSLAGKLRGLGADGERVLLLYPAGLEYLVAFFGCLYAGAVAVPAYPPRRNRSLGRLQAIAADAEVTIALTTSAVYEANASAFGDDPLLRNMRWRITDRPAADDTAGEWREQSFDGERLAFLQYTSGSTATPRGVMVSHGNLLHNQRIIRRVFGQSEESVIVGWLPLYHDMGLIGNVLQTLYVGASCFLMSPAAFLQKPSRWLKAISTYGATTSGGPNFAYDLCARRATPELLDSLDLSRWMAAFNGAEPVRHETLERFAATFEPCGFRREAFQPCYGLAEATLLVAGSPKGRGAVVESFGKAALASDEVIEEEGDGAVTLVSCGAGPSDQKVLIVDPKSLTPSAPDRVGEIWVSGPSVARGYWNRPEETARTFQATPAETGEGPFLRTGDLGLFHRGELFITGRLKDLIIIRGLNHYPQDIELTVERSHAALRPGAGAVFSVSEGGEERLVVVQELDRRGADLQEVAGRVREAITREHEVPVYALALIRKHSLPKTSSGKVQRNLCRSKFLAGELETEFEWREERAPKEADASGVRAGEPVGPLDLESLEAWLKAELAAALGVSGASIDASRSLTGYGLDSLGAVELAHKIQSRLGVALPAASVIEDMSVAGLAALILSESSSSLSPSPTSPEPSDTGAAEHPLSYGQQGLWFLQQLAPQSAAYNIAFQARVSGELDASALRRAFRRLAGRHASLRTTFDTSEGQPVQRVREQADILFREEEVSASDAAALQERLLAEVARPFDLEHDTLLRVFLFKSSERSCELLLVVHHIIADMWSLSILMRELAEFYREETGGRPARLAPRRSQYTDYARRQAAALSGPEGERLWEYWRRQLSGELPTLRLPAAAARPQGHLSRKGSESFRVGRALLDSLKAVGSARGATLYVTLLAAFQTLLYRYTGQEDILVGSPTANRDRAELAGLVGFFMNLVVLRADLSGNPTFEELLGRTRLDVLGALRHQEYPFPLLVQRLHPERDPGRAPLVQAVFNLRSADAFDGGGSGRLELGGAAVEPSLLEPSDAQFDLTLVAVETGEGLAASFQYNAELFDGETVGRLASHFQSLLASIAQNPSQRVALLALFSPEERSRLLQRGARPATHVPDLAAHQLFEAQAARTPEAVAVRFEGAALTYAQLNRRADALARRLRDLGVGPETLVGLLLQRSPEMLTALLAVHKCGGAYVPLDPHMPPQRTALMLEDAGLSLLVTQRELRRLVQTKDGGAGPRVLDIEETEWDGAADAGLMSAEDFKTQPGWRERLAYVIYTSGSTGRPKGVQVTHGAVVNFLRSMSRRPGLGGDDLVLALTPLSFDIAVLELLLPLAVGGCTEIVGREVAGDGAALQAYIRQARPTVMQATPATWRMLVESEWEGSEQLKVLCGGEALPSELAAALLGRVGEVWNMYGPTETTIWSAAAEVGAEQVGRGPVVELGEAVGNTQLYVLDAGLQPVPQGVVGELFIGGAGLARGYLRAPALTARSFVPDPFSETAGARLYRTGDLARRGAGGALEYVGRRDGQVKLRGHRVELGEVEAVLRSHPAVADCAVAARGGAGGGPVLAAYFVAAGGGGWAEAEGELRAHARVRLPEYMRPAAYVRLEALPLTPHGKVDRARLPEPAAAGGAGAAGPRTELERVVARAWAEVLGRGGVGRDEGFFEAGGHSLLAARLAARLRARCGAAVSVRDIFDHPTVAGMAALITDRQVREAAPPQTIKRADRLNTQQMMAHLDELSDEEMASLLNSLSNIG